jgi:hypothetical protein
VAELTTPLFKIANPGDDSTADEAASYLTFQPGVSRDSTVADSDQYVDAQHCRFYQGSPKKIGGYRRLAVAEATYSNPRGVFTVVRDGYAHIYVGCDNGLFRVTVDTYGSGAAILDMTPTSFPYHQASWSFDAMWDASGTGKVLVFAHSGALSTDSSEVYKIYYADDAADSAFAVLTGAPEVSGGLVVMPPFLFAYGSGGLIQNSEPNNPFDWTAGSGKFSNAVNVAHTNIVAGLAYRGSMLNKNQAPGGIFLSQTSAIEVTYVGGDQIWAYNTLSSNITVMGPNCIVDLNGAIFWVGTATFYILTPDGVIQQVPCPSHRRWFFDEVTQANRAKVWAVKVQQYSEIWIFHPRDGADECTHALIYNYESQCWYDTQLARMCGSTTQLFQNPIFVDVDGSGAPRLWLHEAGTDAVTGSRVSAIKSWFQTSLLGRTEDGGIYPLPVRLTRLIVDAIQSGNLDVSVLGADNIRRGWQYTHGPWIVSTTDQFVIPRTQHPYQSVKVTSNVVGGNYWMGRTMVALMRGDTRALGSSDDIALEQ